MYTLHCTVAEFGKRLLSPKSEGITIRRFRRLYSCRKKRRQLYKSLSTLSPNFGALSCRFRRQSHFSATVWTGLKLTLHRTVVDFGEIGDYSRKSATIHCIVASVDKPLDSSVSLHKTSCASVRQSVVL